jgi:hypothetical protein
MTGSFLGCENVLSAFCWVPEILLTLLGLVGVSGGAVVDLMVVDDFAESGDDWGFGEKKLSNELCFDGVDFFLGVCFIVPPKKIK